MTELRPDRDFIEIVNFFEKLAGRWFSQRTTHALSTQQSKAGKSDLEVTFLAPDTDAVQQLWQTHLAVQPNATPLCGLQIQQSSTIEGDSQPQVLTTTLLVPLTPHLQAGESYTGALLRSGADYPSTYTLAAEVLSTINQDKEAHCEERLWFINDNLRMRTSMTELASGLRVASFCSEIRLGAKKPPQAA